MLFFCLTEALGPNLFRDCNGDQAAVKDMFILSDSDYRFKMTRCIALHFLVKCFPIDGFAGTVLNRFPLRMQPVEEKSLFANHPGLVFHGNRSRICNSPLPIRSNVFLVWLGSFSVAFVNSRLSQFPCLRS